MCHSVGKPKSNSKSQIQNKSQIRKVKFEKKSQIRQSCSGENQWHATNRMGGQIGSRQKDSIRMDGYIGTMGGSEAPIIRSRCMCTYMLKPCSSRELSYPLAPGFPIAIFRVARILWIFHSSCPVESPPGCAPPPQFPHPCTTRTGRRMQWRPCTDYRVAM